MLWGVVLVWGLGPAGKAVCKWKRLRGWFELCFGLNVERCEGRLGFRPRLQAVELQRSDGHSIPKRFWESLEWWVVCGAF